MRCKFLLVILSLLLFSLPSAYSEEIKPSDGSSEFSEAISQIESLAIRTHEEEAGAQILDLLALSSTKQGVFSTGIQLDLMTVSRDLKTMQGRLLRQRIAFGVVSLVAVAATGGMVRLYLEKIGTIH